MLSLQTLIAIGLDLLRTLLAEVLSERVRGIMRGMRGRRQISGLAGALQHLHRRRRERLLNRLSTEPDLTKGT